jgi:MSHA biogenesis protein MshQ
MHHVTMKRSGTIRYSALVIFGVSMSMSGIASAESINLSATNYGECPDSADGNVHATSEYIPIAYSGAAITLGAHSNVYGDIQSVAAVTLGEAADVGGSILAGAAVTVEKDGKVNGDVRAGQAATLGDSASVCGDLSARAEVFIGAQSKISGDLTSSRGITLGAAAKVLGNTTAENSVTLGAGAEAASSVRAMTGPIILGAHATVQGAAEAGSIISMGMNAIVEGTEKPNAVPEHFDNKAESPIAKKTDELTQKQKKLSETFVETYNELTTTIDTSRDFYPGVYHASALTTTAGITLTFIGDGPREQVEWLINIDTYLSFGANVTIDLVDVAEGSSIIFNTGTYTTIGANSIFRGVIVAGSYITTGENTTITGVGEHCGGISATNGAITIGAHSTFGASGCWQTRQEDESYEHENHEDESYEHENHEDERYEDESYEHESYEDESYEDESYEHENHEDESYEDEYNDD